LYVSGREDQFAHRSYDGAITVCDDFAAARTIEIYLSLLDRVPSPRKSCAIQCPQRRGEFAEKLIVEVSHIVRFAHQRDDDELDTSPSF
jgi:hypothetical protein